MPNIDNWIRITNPTTDFARLTEELADRPPFYTVICKGGKIRTCYIICSGNGDIQYFESMSGANGIIYPKEIVAIQPIDIPEDIVNTVCNNPKADRSYFKDFYTD